MDPTEVSIATTIYYIYHLPDARYPKTMYHMILGLNQGFVLLLNFLFIVLAASSLAVCTGDVPNLPLLPHPPHPHHEDLRSDGGLVASLTSEAFVLYTYTCTYVYLFICLFICL